MSSKFSRVLKLAGDYHTISHDGQTYVEEHEGTGLFEAPHKHADHLVASGFAVNYADTMEAALEKHIAESGTDAKKEEAPARKPGKL